MNEIQTEALRDAWLNAVLRGDTESSLAGWAVLYRSSLRGDDNPALDIHVMRDGRLQIIANHPARCMLNEDDNNGEYSNAMFSLFEEYATNGRYALFDAGDGNPFVGLTSAPCIAESMSVDDDGVIDVAGRLWYYQNYMLRNYVDDLVEQGFAVFDLA